MNTKTESTSSLKHLARIAGVFYLLVAIFGGFAEGFGDPKMYVAGNAAATVANVLADPGLVRTIVVAHLVNAIFFVLSAQVFFGLWLAPLGYLAYKSELFPKALSILLVIAEVWMLGYLLVVGVRTVKPDKDILAAATS